MSDKLPVRMTCPKCNGENISRDGTLRWDTTAQKWYVSGEHDTFYCDDCDVDFKEAREEPMGGVLIQQLPDVLVVVEGLRNPTKETIQCYINQSATVGRVMILGHSPDESTDPALDAISLEPQIIGGSDAEWDSEIASEQDRGNPGTCGEFLAAFMERFG